MKKMGARSLADLLSATQMLGIHRAKPQQSVKLRYDFSILTRSAFCVSDVTASS